MRRVVFLFVLLAALVSATPAGAITNGKADGNAHPNVGGLVAATAYSDGTWLYCSGTLLAPRVFLTAAHCGADGEAVRVSFDPAYQPGRSEEHTSELQSRQYLVCRLLLEKKK